jgi:uncharacterized protein (DUF58 family)
VDRIWWFVAAILALFGALQQNHPLLVLSLLLALVGAASHLWTRYCLSAVRYQRRVVPSRVFFGEEADLFLETVNAKPLPLAWLRAVDEFPADVQLLTGGLNRTLNPRRRLLINSLSVRWYEKVVRRYRVRAVRRGAWEFGPASLVSGDIFGLSLKREKLAETDLLIVYPKIVPITALGLPALHPFGDFRTVRRTMDDPLRVLGAREYVPGDSLRRIHWKTTAHRRSLQTKVFEPSAARPLVVFLNIRTSEVLGVNRDVLELGIIAAASIAHWAWDAGHPVGLYVNSIVQPSRQQIRIPPATHPDRLMWILDALARVDILGPWSIATVIQRESASLRYGSTIVVISPVINDRLKRTLMDVRRREHSVTLVTLGEAGVVDPLPGIRSYYIGEGREWRDLEALQLAG